MGVKSTVKLTRKEAIKRAADIEQEQMRRKIEAKYFAMTNKELEDELESLNDSQYTECGFENYIITDNEGL